MKKTSFTAEITKTDKTKCKVCQQNIPKGVLRIKIHSYDHFDYYHFNCYKPKLQQYISKADLVLKLDEENSKVLDEWLNSWNINFVPLDKPYHEPPKHTKLVESEPSKLRRAWIEVFKFMHTKDVVKTLTLVNKEFYHITWDEELWHFYCVRDFSQDQTQSTYRNQYATLMMEACFGCHAIQDAKGFYRCPLIGKPLCQNCRSTDKRFVPISKGYINRCYGVNPNILNLKFGQGYGNKQMIYYFMLNEALKIYRKKNKEGLLKGIKKHNAESSLIELVENIDTENMDVVDLYGRVDTNMDPAIDHPLYNAAYNFIRNKEGGNRAKSRIYTFTAQI